MGLKSLTFEYVPVKTIAPDGYVRLNPQGLMPALEVDGRIVAQSSAILEFLEETYPAVPLLPSDSWSRAQVRAFCAHVSADIHAITSRRIRVFLKDDLNAGDEGITRWLRHWMDKGFTALETALASRTDNWTYCFGNTPGWADLHLVPQLRNARNLDCNITRFTRLLTVEARCVDLEAFKLAHPQAQPDYPGK